MAPKRDRESDESAARGAKKPRKDESMDDDDDEEMQDAPPEDEGLDEADDMPTFGAAGGEAVGIPRIELEDLDYRDLPWDLNYDNNGSVHPNYSDKTAKPTQAVPKGPIPVPPESKAPPAPSKAALEIALDSEKRREEAKGIKALFQAVKRLDGGWIGVKGELGSGGQGCARLFVRCDENQKITERIVIKDSWSKTYWDNKDWWEEGRYRCDPRESITHRLLTLPTPNKWERHLVEYISHSVNFTWQTCRTYMEYCEGGDLNGLKRAQKKKYRHVFRQSGADSGSEKGSGSEKDPATVKTSASEVVPEPFVWYYLKQMAIALHRMENIPLKRYMENYVVHQDIKPLNIFMTKPDPQEFPRYPICKIGDFGSARITTPFDENNPGWGDAVTDGFIPPEMDRGVSIWKTSTATNVWQIAQSIVVLMRLEDPESNDYTSLDLDEDEYLDSLADLDSCYSDALRDLLRDMLRADPDTRPTPRDIIKQFYDSETHWKEMATAPSCNEFDLWPQRLHWAPSEKLQINDFFDDIPSLPKEKKPKAKKGGSAGPDSSDDEDSSGDDGGDQDPGDADDEAAEEDYNDYDDDPMEGPSGSSLSSESEYVPSRPR